MVGSSLFTDTTHFSQDILLDGLESGFLADKGRVLATLLDHFCALLKGDRAALWATTFVFASPDEVLHIDRVDT